MFSPEIFTAGVEIGLLLAILYRVGNLDGRVKALELRGEKR